MKRGGGGKEEEGEEREGEPMDAVDEDEAAMMAMMGFGGFNTTKVSYIKSVRMKNNTEILRREKLCKGMRKVLLISKSSVHGASI